MVGRLTRRIYIYGLDGLFGIPENFVGCRSQYARNKAIARSIQEIATPQHPAFPPSPIPGPQFSLAVASGKIAWHDFPMHSRIKSASSNFQWHRNLYRRNVSHSLDSTLAPPQLRASEQSTKISAEVRSLLALGHRSSWQPCTA